VNSAGELVPPGPVVTGGVVNLLADTDGDGVPDGGDNCPSVSNAAQTISDGEVRPNGPNIAGDDATWPMRDLSGDACDTDDDNDGLTDAGEASGAGCGGIVTNPARVDTDGDHLTDGWECANGSNPADASSRALGAPSAADLDADNVFDQIELRGYASRADSSDSDLDGCPDLVEIGSVNGDRALNGGDLLLLNRRTAWPAVTLVPPEAVQDSVLDINKDGFVNATDVLMLNRWVNLLAPAPCQ
jgi:hypothetical protein